MSSGLIFFTVDREYHWKQCGNKLVLFRNLTDWLISLFSQTFPFGPRAISNLRIFCPSIFLSANIYFPLRLDNRLFCLQLPAPVFFFFPLPNGSWYFVPLHYGLENLSNEEAAAESPLGVLLTPPPGLSLVSVRQRRAGWWNWLLFVFIIFFFFFLVEVFVFVWGWWWGEVVASVNTSSSDYSSVLTKDEGKWACGFLRSGLY